jgi:hypothetical protein
MQLLVNFLVRLPWSGPIVRSCASELSRLPHRIPESPVVSFTNPISANI